MPVWLAVVLAGCAVVISLALVLVLLSVRRTVDRTGAILAIVEREMPPLATEARGLTSDARALTQASTRELKRVGDVIERVHDVAEGVGRVVNALAVLTRAGQLVGVAAAVRRGVEVFVQRMRKEGGNHHGQ
jgi:uncharacterized protein YoxC